VTPRDRLCVALDFDDGQTARALAGRLEGRCGWFKVGLELFVSEGPALVTAIAREGRVFLDLKLHDIPNTVAGAARAAARTGAAMINVHASGGREMMEAARDALGAGNDRPKLIAVTLLTSIGTESMAELPFEGSPASVVERLAALAAEAGLDGVVCSAGEVAAIRAARGPEFLAVVPGIRPSGAEAGDQKRIATPSSALAAGASILVVGRPVTRASDPVAAVEAIVEEMSAV
jgi:orotidine-5'-phosphate decarboxylase